MPKDIFLKEVEYKFKTSKLKIKANLSNPKGIYECFVEQIGCNIQEELWVISLSAQNELVALNLVSKGTAVFVPADPKDVFRSAILLNASSIVIIHNHPSGNLVPSTEDKRCCNATGKAGLLLGVMVLDFVVVSEQGYCSFRSQNLIGSENAIPPTDEKP